ncbi:hypothetical protein UFOVP1226_49 [uncultured Caudovirales phage]|uniref:Uncharacterized protein n=1 Tax=uncultured Caudovirales phage TaxID=2100421 RepID=A0A6J5LTK5_9CAUD|nr:hypothetical protein UFOVP278_48 [uncultured Caudovirales phage]CAB4191509.1 hypothetical protein UFOVP1226_49 [uncultured Caudovirales phage]
MAIGSTPEIGTTFGLWRDMTPEQRTDWFTYMEKNWGAYLMAGYATLVHNKKNRYYQKKEPHHA